MNATAATTAASASLQQQPAAIRKRGARVVFTMLSVASIAAVMLLFLGKISRNGASSTTSHQVSSEHNNIPTIISEPAYSTNTPPSNNNNNKMKIKNNNKPNQQRVLCYGDSLTAGSSGMNQYPYATFLQDALSKSNNKDIVVRHRGMPGWTTKQMLNDLDGKHTGLRSAIRNVKSPGLSLVIILVGTNDLGYEIHKPNAETTITNNILQLHEICHELGVPQTIAVGIPPSGYQAQNKNARELANSINQNLQEFANAKSSNGKMVYMPFPFDFVSGGENWNMDTLHFSKIGYQNLGMSLAPVVEQVLLAGQQQQQENNNNNEQTKKRRNLVDYLYRKKEEVAPK